MSKYQEIADMAAQLLTAAPTLNEMGLMFEMKLWPATEHYDGYLALRICKVEVVGGETKCTFHQDTYVEAGEMEKATKFVEDCIRKNK